MKRVFQTSDKLTFETEHDALNHEEGLKRVQAELVEKFKRGYTGLSLLKKHNLNEFGIWEVRGEDENCGMAGAHYTPLLGYFEGKLADVIEHAVGLNMFWQWGGGGEINSIAVQSVPEKIGRSTR